MAEEQEKTVGEILIERLEKVANAFEELKLERFPRSLLIIYINDRTRLGKRNIEAVLDAIEEFRREMGMIRRNSDV